MDNTEDMYGKISDLSGVENVENDNDSVNKKQDYESRYSEREANQLAQQQAEQEEKRKPCKTEFARSVEVVLHQVMILLHQSATPR